MCSHHSDLKTEKKALPVFSKPASIITRLSKEKCCLHICLYRSVLPISDLAFFFFFLSSLSLASCRFTLQISASHLLELLRRRLVSSNNSGKLLAVNSLTIVSFSFLYPVNYINITISYPILHVSDFISRCSALRFSGLRSEIVFQFTNFSFSSVESTI